MSRYTKSSGSLLQKILIIALIIAAIATLGSLVPSSGGNKATTSSDKNTNTVRYNTLYLVPSRDWASDNSSYAAWCFSSTNYPAAGHVSGTDTDGDGVFEFVIPDYYDNVIFIDVNPGTSFSGNWDNKREQTSDLVVPINENVYYHQYASEWRADGESTEPEVFVTTEPVTITIKALTSNTGVYVFNGLSGENGTFIETTTSNYSGYVILTATIPVGNTHVIIVTPSDTTQAASWENCGAKTDDLLIPTDGNTYYDLIADSGWIAPETTE